MDALSRDSSSWLHVGLQPYGTNRDSPAQWGKAMKKLAEEGLTNTIVHGHFTGFKILATVPDLQATSEIMFRMLQDEGAASKAFSMAARIVLTDSTCWIPKDEQRTAVEESDFVITLGHGVGWPDFSG